MYHYIVYYNFEKIFESLKNLYFIVLNQRIFELKKLKSLGSIIIIFQPTDLIQH